jgi:hypothetical protein
MDAPLRSSRVEAWFRNRARCGHVFGFVFRLDGPAALMGTADSRPITFSGLIPSVSCGFGESRSDLSCHRFYCLPAVRSCIRLSGGA